MRDDADENHEFEFESILKPPAGDEIHLGKGSFVFNLPFYRITVRLFGLPLIKGDGILLMESRIRRAGSTKGWLRQTYPIIIERIPGSDAGGARQAGTIEVAAPDQSKSQDQRAAATD